MAEDEYDAGYRERAAGARWQVRVGALGTYWLPPEAAPDAQRAAIVAATREGITADVLCTVTDVTEPGAPPTRWVVRHVAYRYARPA